MSDVSVRRHAFVRGGPQLARVDDVELTEQPAEDLRGFDVR
jgi:hypothetical protein